MNDERKTNNGANGRRPWTQRYLSLIIFVIATLIGFATTQIHTWATANAALSLASNVSAEVEKRTETVYSVPHLKDKLDNHVQDFKEYKTEQRQFNNNVNDKLDYIVRNIRGT